jgi:hypothetical protein
MPNVIVTGGPGAGKTTLLTELAALGYATVEESARAIIAERLASGASRRPDFPAFAREILRRDIEKYRGQPRTSNWVFFDRGVLDALGMLQEVAPLPARELKGNALHIHLSSDGVHPAALGGDLRDRHRTRPIVCRSRQRPHQAGQLVSCVWLSPLRSSSPSSRAAG